MGKKVKRIGVLTSGGDAPGMNAAIRSVVRKTKYEGLEIRGILRGYEGLINGEFIEMDSRSVSNILGRGGTILKTARSKDFRTKKGQAKASKVMEENGIDALVIIGGNGSFQGAIDFYNNFGVKSVGIPGTIDNDLGYTDYTVGAHTSVDTVLDAVDKIRDTVTSMERVYVIEVMGREEPYIAIMAGLAGGAEEILYPGSQVDLDQVASEIEEAEKKGKRSWIIIVSEGYASAHVMAEQIRQRTGFSVRGVTLGHIQRGGSPNAPDRILASIMGAYAVNALMEGHFGKMVGIKGSTLQLVPYEKACFERDKDRELHSRLYALTKLLAS
ncbi:MAG: 6-phosphofructokinase [Candidatus Omnitrophota bacterium]|nr:6-phosphofructokinase [Candidatus Omnitrophota bacterium]